MEDNRIIEILLRMEENQQKFFSEAISLLRNERVKTKDQEFDINQWGDILDIQNLLKKSRRTVYRIIDENNIQSMPIRGTTLYYLPDFCKPSQKIRS